MPAVKTNVQCAGEQRTGSITKGADREVTGEQGPSGQLSWKSERET